MWVPLAINAVMSVLSYHVCVRLIPSMKESFIKAGMAGKDLNKPPEEKKLIPEGLGAVCGCVFLMVMFLFIPIPSFITTATLDNQFVHLLCALLSICCMILLGFSDDVLDLRWRHKLLLPTMASLPLLTVYFASGGLTSVLLPWPFRSDARQIIELSILYYLYMALLAVFCTNAINILAGINGVEVGQSVVIATCVIVHNLIELAGANWQQHLFSLYIMLPFLAVSMALLYHNWYPSEVFVGDTYCYFAGMTFAVVAILGHFSKTLLLFFIPQIINFTYSIPQLFHLLPCPRHRLPRYDNKTRLLNMSYASYNPTTVHSVVMTTLRLLYRLGLVHIEVITNGVEERINNLTVINLVIKLIGPVKEPVLTSVMITIQVTCSILAFTIRYWVAGIFY